MLVLGEEWFNILSRGGGRVRLQLLSSVGVYSLKME